MKLKVSDLKKLVTYCESMSSETVELAYIHRSTMILTRNHDRIVITDADDQTYEAIYIEAKERL